MFENKTLMITGGTGSFGNAVLERFIASKIQEIRVFSRDEKKQDEMRHAYQDDRIHYYVGDVRDALSVQDAMHGVDFVFHAAALKQVPSCEFFPIEAVKTNVLGTDNVLNACISQRVKKVICLSTDKACYPVNAMGTSKAMMEKVFVAKSRTIDANHTLICGTRYGNVMCSRGSVIPLFIEQIKQGKPLTVTDPKMTRFIMSLPEALDLVLYAFENAHQGDIFVQKAASCRIGDLAVAISELFGVQRQYEIIGTRHGEKDYEVLMTNEEASKATDLGHYFRIPADNRDLNYDKYIADGSPKISKSSEYSSNNTSLLTVDQIKETLLTVESVREELDAWKGSNR